MFHKLGDGKQVSKLPKGAVSYDTKNVTLVANTPEETTTYKYDGERHVMDLKAPEFGCNSKEEKIKKEPDQVKDEKIFDTNHEENKHSQRDTQPALQDDSADSFYTPVKDGKGKPEDPKSLDDKDYTGHHHDSHTLADQHASTDSSSKRLKPTSTVMGGMSIFIFLSSSLFYRALTGVPCGSTLS